MSGIQQLHYWVSVCMLTLALISIITMAVGASFPVKSKRGDQILSWGLVSLIFSVTAYLVYAITIITTIAVMRA